MLLLQHKIGFTFRQVELGLIRNESDIVFGGECFDQYASNLYEYSSNLKTIGQTEYFVKRKVSLVKGGSFCR